MQQASYLTSLQIAILGGAPFLWKPLSNRFGRRPVFLLSTILSLVCNVGCAKSYTYASMAACRALTAFFICPPTALGSAVVAETFFKRDRARYMGIWTLLITLGIPVGMFFSTVDDWQYTNINRTLDLRIRDISRGISMGLLGSRHHERRAVYPVPILRP